MPLIVRPWTRHGVPHIAQGAGRGVCGVRIPDDLARVWLAHVPSKLCRRCKRLRWNRKPTPGMDGKE